MAIDLTPEQREIGRANFARTADGLTRRGFLRSMAVAGGALVPVSAAVYFGYKGLQGKPVKAALIGGGDEGGVLVGEHNPDYLQFIAVCDIRPSNKKRIFEGDPKVPLRKGFKKVCGKEAAKIKQYDDYLQMLREHKDELEAVVIALPLHLHAKVAVDCMRFGKERGRPLHVLCEKLMAWNIRQCKKMIEVAKDTNSILSIGHQRHYSLLYAHASEVVNAGVLGQIKHIRALWHRNFSWPFTYDSKTDPLVEGVKQPVLRDGWYNPVTHMDYDALKKHVQKYGYDSVEQLVRWRTYSSTGGGLMAELGSHQLDACSIFLGKVHPLAVTGVGTRSFYAPGRNERDIDDHIFVTYEFPGKDHPRGPARPDGTHGTDENDVVVVTYSSISTNSFEQYGECIMGTRGSLVVEAEKSLMLYTESEPGKAKGSPRSMEVAVTSKGSGQPVLETSSTWGGAATPQTGSPAGPVGTDGGPVSRGYREEMEDFAYCVRLWDPKLGYQRDGDKYKQRLPRCHGEVAMADAIVALTANRAMKDRQRIEFRDGWFDAAVSEVPDDPKAKPKIEVE
jgi:predicted dehydrogenase